MGSVIPPCKGGMARSAWEFPSLHRHRIGVERREETVLRAFLVVLSDRQLDRAGAHSLRNRIESGYALAFARRLGRPKQAASRPDDSLVGHAQMLPGAVLDRAHRLLQRRILHRNALHAAIGSTVPLHRAVEQVVVRLVGERNESAGSVLHVNPRAVFHGLHFGRAQRPTRVVIDAPCPAVLVVDRHPCVRSDRVPRPRRNDRMPRHDPRRDAPVVLAMVRIAPRPDEKAPSKSPTPHTGILSLGLYSLPRLPLKSGSVSSSPECRKDTWLESIPPSIAWR